MKRLVKKVFSPPSLQLNGMVVCEVVFLLVASLAVMFYYTRDTLRKESMKTAEQTLEGTVQHVDNVLLSVEQSAGNVYWDLMTHLDHPERMYTYCRKTVECNPNITGCAIAFKPGFYPDRGMFMTYVQRKRYDSPELVTSEAFGSKKYTEQNWYCEPMNTGSICWLNPLKGDPEDKNTSLMSFCIPIYLQSQTTERPNAQTTERLNDQTTERPNDQTTERPNDQRQVVGVFVVNLSLDLLSQIVLAAKPSPNSYSILIKNNGKYIVHPDHDKLTGQAVFGENTDSPSLRETAKAMLAGEKGCKPFSTDGENYFMFFKPFERTNVEGRSMGNLNWSIGLVYPEEDLFHIYKDLFLHVLTIAVIGLLLFFVLTRLIISKQLKPLRKLTETAQSIAEGHFEAPDPEKTKRKDEIGQFQKHFDQMQSALTSRVSELEQLTATLQERGEELRKTYKQTQEDNRVKTTFLHSMSNKMIVNAKAIGTSVKTLCENYQTISLQEANHEIDTIKQKSETILYVLNQMFNASGHEAGKEDDHE